MTEPAPPFSTYSFSRRFHKRYNQLANPVQKQVDKTVTLLFSNPAHPGLETHSIKPARYYREAYVNKSHRLIYVPQGGHLLLADVVSHDDIDRYREAPKGKSRDERREASRSGIPFRRAGEANEPERRNTGRRSVYWGGTTALSRMIPPPCRRGPRTRRSLDLVGG